MIKIHGIDHVALNVRDLDKSLEFYTKVMGLSVTQREYSKPGIEYFLDCGSSLLGLIQGRESEGEHLLQDGGIGGNHVSFRVDTKEFDRMVEEIKRRGLTVTFLKKREKSWSVYFLDPDGNKLEITAWPSEDAQ
jgi:catechol 2,3-dioxygenase-like lactoylglutathione lyase family enzyme